jgi:hypothetical protein
MRLWGPITLRVDLQLQWGLKQSCSPCRELFNDMLYATYTRRNQGDSWLLVVGNQIVNLTSGPSFGHNLCFRCSNGSCKPILDIFVLRFFSNDIRNASIHWVLTPTIALWQFGSPFGTPTFNMRIHLGVWGFIPSHSFALPGAWNVTLKLPSCLAPLQALALVTSPRLGLQH